MKRIILALVSMTFVLNSQANVIEMSQISLTVPAFICHEMSGGLGCLISVSATSAAPTVTTSVLLLKEMQEVKSDAINYVAGETATPALESVVEKIQAAALEQDKEVSFDEVIEALIQL